MSTLAEIEAAIELLPMSQFEQLAQWIEVRRARSSAGKGGQDHCVDGTVWNDTSKAMQEWHAWLDGLEPLFAGHELSEFETNLAQMRAEQKGLSSALEQRIERLFQ